MPFVRMYSHFVWSTKNRKPFLDSPELRRQVWEHMKENASRKGIFIDMVSGYEDHCHCLISIGVDQTLSKIMMLIKEESACWINKHRLCKQKFEWQDEYVAIAVCGSDVERVRQYIKNQEVHHKKIQFLQEYDEFIEECADCRI
jgi:putative transposase